MKILRTQQFVKHFKKRLSLSLQEKFYKKLQLYQENPNNPLLRDHQLSGTKKHLRSFSITGDIRAIYEKQNDGILLIDIGTHNQVY